jgi:hypothetical protein
MNNSSQPYLYYNAHNHKCLLYCYGKSIKTLVYGQPYNIKGWKIRHKNYITNQDIEIITPSHLSGFGAVILECNPHIYDNKLYCTLGTNRGYNTPLVYHLCSFPILDSDTIQLGHVDILQQTFTGTQYLNQLIFDNPQKNGNIIIKNLDNKTTNEITMPTQYIYKINKVFNEDKLIITGQTDELSYFSCLYDINLNFIKEIRNSNHNHIYKCSILDNTIVYTVKHNDSELENRSLVEESWSV